MNAASTKRYQWSLAFVKTCLIAFALMIAKLVPSVLALDWYWYALVFAITYAWLVLRMSKKQEV